MDGDCLPSSGYSIYMVWNIFFSSLLILPPMVFRQTIRTAKDNTHVTGTCHGTASSEIIISTTDVSSERSENNIMGSRLRLCRSKSVYSRRQTAISAPKHIIETTFDAHPDVMNTSIRTSRIQLCTIAFVNWLIRLYSIISGETHSDQTM